MAERARTRVDESKLPDRLHHLDPAREGFDPSDPAQRYCGVLTWLREREQALIVDAGLPKESARRVARDEPTWRRVMVSGTPYPAVEAPPTVSHGDPEAVLGDLERRY